MKAPTPINQVMIYGKTLLGFIILILFVIINPGCKKDSTTRPAIPNYKAVNLVADTVGYNATLIDVNLKNAWGIAIGPTVKSGFLLTILVLQ